MGSRNAKAIPSEQSASLKPRAGRYVRCIEDGAPSRALRNVRATAGANAEVGPGNGIWPEEGIEAEVSPTKDAFKQSQTLTGSPAPRNLEFVCEIEVAGGNGLTALNGGSITFDGRSISLDLDLAPNAQAPAANLQPSIVGLLPAPDTISTPEAADEAAPHLRKHPSSRQVPHFYLDPDFDQALSEDLDFGSAPVQRVRPFPSYQPAAPAFQPQQGPALRNAPYSSAPAAAPAAAPTANQPPKAEAPFQEHHDPAEEEIAENQPKKKKNIIGDIIFYAFLIALVVGAFFISGGSGGGPKMIAGYSAFTVTTGSMHDVLPQGSLIVTKHVEPEELQVGDDITYMISETSSITHRIIGIERNVEGTGELAFKTKGTMNDNPDKNLVPAVNVVGKVVFCSYPLGVAIGFVQDNWPLLIFLTVVAAVLFSVLRRILR